MFIEGSNMNFVLKAIQKLFLARSWANIAQKVRRNVSGVILTIWGKVCVSTASVLSGIPYYVQKINCVEKFHTRRAGKTYVESTQ